MQVRALKVFCDIVGCRSFSKAASENGMSQSAASQIVHQLEQHLGVQLIDRSKRPFVLTPQGQLYYDGCRRLLQQFDRLEEQVRTLHDEVLGRVAVASIYSVGLSHMSAFVQQFLQRNPRANVQLRYEHPDLVYQLVEDDVCDLGLVSFPRGTRTLEATLWREEPMSLVCAPQHPLAGAGGVEWSDLAGIKLIGFDPQLKIRQATDRELAAHDVEATVALEFDNSETIKRAVEVDLGVALLPDPTVEREVRLGTLARVAVGDGEFKRPLGIVARRGKQLGQTAEHFRGLLLESAASSEADGPAAASAAAG